MEKRSHPRVEVSHPVLFFTDIYPRPKVASTLDLSLGGTKIETSCDLLKGQRLEMSIAIHPQSIRCRGKAVYIRGPKSGVIQAGIKFEGLSEHDRHNLLQYISHILETPM
jgi:c-di-GMP-binding flagellar brake protein YcgR